MLQGVRIAIARDAAFCFVYPANLELLAAAGAILALSAGAALAAEGCECCKDMAADAAMSCCDKMKSDAPLSAEQVCRGRFSPCISIAPIR